MTAHEPVGFDAVPDARIERPRVTAVLRVVPELPAGFATPEPLLALEVTGTTPLVARIAAAAADALEDEL